MSSMLEQSIVDATALREAAIQSAEQAVVEKYSNQIKETVEELLEQEEMDLGGDLGGGLDLGGEEDAATGAGPEPKDIAQDADVKHAAAFGSVKNQTLEAFYEALADDVDENTVLEIELDNLDYDAARGSGKNKITPMLETADPEVSVEEKIEEDVSIDEDFLEELAETLTMDYEAQPDGGFANGQMKPTNAFHDTGMVQEIAAEIEEYAAEQNKKNDKLQKENKQLEQKLKKTTDVNKKLMEAVGKIKQKFESVYLMNAKLFYINKALMDGSMNERQREQIVESINGVDSIESAKIVFETLRSTVGISKDRGPKSLSEAVNKRNSSSILLHSRKKEEKNNNTDDFTKRMRRLAGIE